MSWRRQGTGGVLTGVLLLAVGGCTHTAAPPAAGGSTPAATMSAPAPVSAPAVPPARPTTAAARPVSVPAGVPMPNRELTPGSIQSSDTAAVCTPGWASAHRDVSTATKDQVAAAYGLSSRYGYEIDHLIPLELGGSNAVSNLWPEPYYSPYGAIQKDGLEDWLHQQVCAGNLSLATAQHEIAVNWYTTWVGAGKPMPSDFGYSDSPPYSTGSTAPAPASTTSPGGSAGAWCTASAVPANDGYAGDYNVTVHSNQPDQTATASDAGDTHSYRTDASGFALIYLWHTSPGETVHVTVGAASCSTTAQS